MIRLENVIKTYIRRGTTVTAFQCKQLTIAPGDYLAVVGPSGSGKTTLLSILGGMLTPTSGQVWINGVSLYDQSVAARAALRRDELGFVFQTFNLVAYLSALENVQVPLCLSGLPPKEQRDRATAMLTRFGLQDRLQHKPTEMSVGQQQRVALARTLVSDPRVILADEPTGNLDPQSREIVLQALDACRQDGHTIIVVTHDPIAAKRAQKVLPLCDGTLGAVPTWLSDCAA